MSKKTIQMLIIAAFLSTFAAILYIFPEGNVSKFYKGYTQLNSTLGKLVKSRYYSNFDLGITSDGKVLDGSSEDDFSYFCSTFAETAKAKSSRCSNDLVPSTGNYKWAHSLESDIEARHFIDEGCYHKGIVKNVGRQIVSKEGIIFYEAHPDVPFGMDEPGSDNRLFGGSNLDSAAFLDEHGDNAGYKIFCMDIDEQLKDTPPYGFGIGADGKIYLGTYAKNLMERMNTACLLIVALILLSILLFCFFNKDE